MGLKKLLFGSVALFSFLSASAQTQHERIYLGTGEYDPRSNWDGLLRFDAAENYNSIPGDVQYTPDGTIPFKQSYINDTTHLNFGHGLYFHESKDRMYVATIFTNSDNVLTSNSDTAVGAIAIYDNVSTANGAVNPTRFIFGPNTGLEQPHGCWLDETRDILYVANTFGANILCFHNASTISGDVAPDRIIQHDSLGLPLNFFVDTIIDRIFVCAMPAMGHHSPGDPPSKLKSQIAIYNNASTVDGSVEPPVRITGDNTRMMMINQTVHNVWFNAQENLMAVGHHTNELLLFDMDKFDWEPATPTKFDLTPRVIRVDDPTLGYDSTDVNLYGFYWDLEEDVIYCSVGVDNHNGGPINSCPPEAIKIFSNISDSTVSGVLAPDRTIYWSNCSTYYPPQPIWVQKYSETAVENMADVNTSKVYYSKSAGEIFIKAASSANENVQIFDALGTLVFEASYSEVLSIKTATWAKGVYFYQIGNQYSTSAGKLLID